MVKDKKLYNILDVDINASEGDIKKAYNKLSKIWHPDKHQDPEKKKEVTIKFQEINQAKTILLDEQKRQMYDQVGMDIFKYDSEGGVPEDDFENMFGGMGGMGFPFGGMGFPFGENERRKNVPEHIIEQVEASLEDIVCKKTTSVSYNQKIFCSDCDGEGTKNKQKSTCKNCNGKGKQVRITKMGPMIQQIVVDCSMCEGKCVYIEPKNKCEKCNSKGFIIKKKGLQVPLSVDVLFNHDAIFENKGHQLKNMKTHLIVKVKELPHKIFKRLNEDLYMDMELKLYQALFGFDKIINHLDGRQLHISCSGKTKFNDIRKISGEGITNPSGKKGDLYIRFNIIIPDINDLSTDAKLQFKNLCQSFDKDEVLIESQITNSNKIIKTICSDLKQTNAEKVSLLMDKLKNTKPEKERKQPMFNENEGQPQCAQQ